MAHSKKPPIRAQLLVLVRCDCGELTCTRHPDMLHAQGWQLDTATIDWEWVHGVCPSCSHAVLTCYHCRCGWEIHGISDLLIAAGWQLEPLVLCPLCLEAHVEHISKYEHMRKHHAGTQH